MALASTRRNIRPSGDPDNFYVLSQNALVERLLLVSVFARSRGCIFIWEQPSSSVMWDYPPVAEFLTAAPDVSRLRI